MPGDAVKVTELTVSDTHIGGIHISIYLPGNKPMSHLFLPQLICYMHQFCQWCLFEKVLSFFFDQEL
jgi:hypothetical protein